MPSGETIIFQEHPSWFYFSGLIMLAGMSFFIMQSAGGEGAFVIALFLLMLAAFAKFRRLYTITDRRVMMKIGLVANNTNEMEIRHIRGMNIRQNVWERVLGVGTLEIISAADGGAEVVFKGVRDPNGVRDKIRRIKLVP